MAASSGARLQRKAARTVVAAASAHPFRRCYGTEFTSNAILRFADRMRVDWHYIAPGKPIQNAFIRRRSKWSLPLNLFELLNMTDTSPGIL
jgi:putative transposase